MMQLYSWIKKFYKTRISNLMSYSTKLDPQKTAMAFASAFCIGITPLLGFTFIIATSFGLFFRLNQIIMQSVHLLVLPLQVALFYPFMFIGKLVFGLQHAAIPVSNISKYIVNYPGDFLHKYSMVFISATTIWLIVSLAGGFIIYKVLLAYFRRLANR